MAQAPLIDSFAAPDFLTIFADNVHNIANSRHVVKFFLARIEPSLMASGATKGQAVAQVVMPLDGFVATFVFFEGAIKRYLEQGLISEEMLRTFRSANTNVEWKGP